MRNRINIKKVANLNHLFLVSPVRPAIIVGTVAVISVVISMRIVAAIVASSVFFSVLVVIGSFNSSHISSGNFFGRWRGIRQIVSGAASAVMSVILRVVVIRSSIIFAVIIRASISVVAETMLLRQQLTRCSSIHVALIGSKNDGNATGKGEKLSIFHQLLIRSEFKFY